MGFGGAAPRLHARSHARQRTDYPALMDELGLDHEGTYDVIVKACPAAPLYILLHPTAVRLREGTPPTSCADAVQPHILDNKHVHVLILADLCKRTAYRTAVCARTRTMRGSQAPLSGARGRTRSSPRPPGSTTPAMEGAGPRMDNEVSAYCGQLLQKRHEVLVVIVGLDLSQPQRYLKRARANGFGSAAT